MTEHGGDLEAARALHVHEEAVGVLYQALELVLLFLVDSRRVQQVVIDRHACLLQEEGASWGVDGYVKIGAGSSNVCGILSAASYPTE